MLRLYAGNMKIQTQYSAIYAGNMKIQAQYMQYVQAI